MPAGPSILRCPTPAVGRVAANDRTQAGDMNLELLDHGDRQCRRAKNTPDTGRGWLTASADPLTRAMETTNHPARTQPN
ncbi:hypothetical protein GCM10012284_28590 [Mangrovihabitans endophyticus]|uniref:Uncharacterized protein n=1 Tax=Mangrovihabitans endophyticus TaxID=1751298 RepID=A0A8J3FNP3_9ACTN|nr:hypothetical protein GCM10012284_28590 [Mangrovihabitans endophyticus]